MAREIWERFDMMEFLGQLGVTASPEHRSRQASQETRVEKERVGEATKG